MERESFEDAEVAALLNEHFIAIKVDREERPDVDNLYMAVCQAMTGQGGWPLTVLLTPEKKPFFAGTYFPKRRKYGRYGLMDILGQIAGKWQDAEERERILDIGEQVVAETQARMLSNMEGELDDDALERAFEQYERTFDAANGGFGAKPKFPTPHNLSLLLRYHRRTGNTKALAMVEQTLDAMYRGGLYDHIGYGFARYSTDERWLVPHFEKMLYDNALLAMAYVEAYQVTGKEGYAEVAGQIFAYVLRDMTHPEGGFYSAEDADSEGVEGKFYVWTPEEVRHVLGEEDGELVNELFDITPEGNFEGASIPNLIGASPEQFAARKRMPLEQLEERVEAAREKLFRHREKRVHPHKDDKVLTSWNGLMIAALAKAAKALDQPDYAAAAARAADFILVKLRREDGRLLARYRDGDAAYLGYVDDYAFLVWGLIELYEATFELRYMEEAIRLNADMLRLFWDDEKGGLFFYGSDAEQLFTRPKESYDGAMPSGNSAAALNLLKLAKLTYDAALSQRADEQLRAFAGALQQYPAGHALMLAALDFAQSPGREIVIAGDPAKEETREMIRACYGRFAPHAVTILHPPGEAGQAVRKLLPLAEGKPALGGRATAYVCENYACHSPASDLDELEEALQAE
ncbi:MAG: thioredoxin domain-containing protein [Paenibacillaceae bacterium]|nr:thioredoxin domain-containing protein [Paenibacillaceae bacterium]